MCSYAFPCGNPAILRPTERARSACGLSSHASSSASHVPSTLTSSPPPGASLTTVGGVLV